MPILNIVMAMIAILAVLGGDFNRQGYGRRIALAGAGAVLLLAVQLALQSAAASDPVLNVLLLGLPLASTGILSWIYFGRGARIGRALGLHASPALPAFREGVR
jgi:lipopolysaccharide export system permease protein